MAALFLRVIRTSAVGPAYVITGNWVEDNEHSFAGLVVFQDAKGDFICRCRGTDFAYRIDQPDVLAWIQSYMQKRVNTTGDYSPRRRNPAGIFYVVYINWLQILAF